MKKLLYLFLLLPALVVAQTKPKPAMSWKDVASFKSIVGTTLSPDGQWFAYVLTPNEGDSDLIVQKTTDTTKYTYAIGSGSFAQVSFSDDSKFLAFKVFPKDKEKKAAAKSPGKPLPEKLWLIDLAKNKKTEFEKVKSFAFNGEKASHLAIQLTSDAAPAGPPSLGGAASSAPKGSDLLLYDLATGKTQNIGNVSEYSFDKKGNSLAMTIDAANQAGNGVHLRNMSNGLTTILESEKANYKSLSWTEKGDAFALLKSAKDEKYKNEPTSVFGVRNVAGTPEIVTYEPKTDSIRFPKGMTVSANRRPYWSEDLSLILFGIQKLELAKKEDKKSDAGKKPEDKKPDDKDLIAKIKADTTIKSLEDLQKALAKAKPDTAKARGAAVGGMPAMAKDDAEKPEMTIWHWQDKRLQSRQQVMETQDKNFNFLCSYVVADKKFNRLSDSTLMSISVAPKQIYGIGSDDDKYELDDNLNGQNHTDVYVVDLKTGSRTKVIENFYQPNFWASPNPSQDGTKFLYWQDGHWFAYDIVAKSSKNLTQNVPTSFVNIEDDHNVKLPPNRVVGWTNDSKAVLLSDGWDIWNVPVETKNAKGKDILPVNLTQNGKKDKIRYQQRYSIDPEEKGIDLKLPQYFRIYGEWNKKSGLARIDNGLPGAKPLLWEDANIGNFVKAKKSTTYLYSSQMFTKAPEFFVTTSGDLAAGKQVSKNCPDLAKYAWSSGTRLVNYVSDKGDSLQGALFLPAGYEEGKKYPTLVYYYEKLSETLHSFATPSYPGGGWNPSLYTSNGYAVFIPDIVYKFNDPGMSAVWCVLPGVKAAIKTGVIDETRIGIHGHSWGGYQTSFLITQTSMFKAAAAGAPLTDMISMYNLIYKNSGSANGAIFEASQGRLEEPWNNWEAYNRNSPIYNVKKVTTPLLMLHNDADGAVDFTQGIEYYNALRRLKKPVVLIQYKGENHGLAKLVNRKDYAVRMMEFFDHHLKGKTAPDWLQKGVEKLQLDEHLEKRTMGTEE